MPNKKATWPVLDGDGNATGARKASLVTQMRELRGTFQKERARLAESEKSGGYVVAKSKRKARPKPAIDSAAERIGTALGKLIAILDGWRANGTGRPLQTSPSKGALGARSRRRPMTKSNTQTKSPQRKDEAVRTFDQKAGDRSSRAARSGATGERGTSGGRNKPAPKDQDEKGMGHPRNR